MINRRPIINKLHADLIASGLLGQVSMCPYCGTQHDHVELATFYTQAAAKRRCRRCEGDYYVYFDTTVEGFTMYDGYYRVRIARVSDTFR